jgi:hypothetical protein
MLAVGNFRCIFSQLINAGNTCETFIMINTMTGEHIPESNNLNSVFACT